MLPNPSHVIYSACSDVFLCFHFFAYFEWLSHLLILSQICPKDFYCFFLCFEHTKKTANFKNKIDCLLWTFTKNHEKFIVKNIPTIKNIILSQITHLIGHYHIRNISSTWQFTNFDVPSIILWKVKYHIYLLEVLCCVFHSLLFLL